MADLVKARVLVGGWYWEGRKMWPGDEVQAPEKQIVAWEESGTVERVEASAPAPPEPQPEPKPEPEQDPTDEAPDEAPEWPHKISPEHYLNRFPEGPDADLARSLRGQIEE